MNMNQYKIIGKVNKRLYCKNSPITIEKYAFLYDSFKGKNMIQLKLRNISNKRIANIEIVFQTIDDEKNLVEEFSHKFEAVNAESDSVFGDQEPIYFDGLNVENIRFALKQVEYDEGKGEKNIGIFSEVESPGELEVLGEYKTTYCEVFEAKTHCKCVKNIVTEKADIWYCACGNIQQSNNRFCRCCGAELDKIKKISEKAYLREKASEIAEAKLKLKEKQEKQKKKFVKGAVAIACILVFVMVAKFLYGVISQRVELHNKYKTAVAAIDNNEFDTARKLFAELGGYKDSEIQASSIDDLEREYNNQQVYNKAQKLLESRKYNEAIKDFTDVRDYADSKDKIKECYYVWAKDYVENAMYEEGIATFIKAEDYGDAEEQVTKTTYMYAKSNLEDGNYDKAIELFGKLAEYEDSQELLSTSYFKRACKAKNIKQYEEAIEYFVKVKGNDKSKAIEEIKECTTLQLVKENKQNYRLATDYAAKGKLNMALEKLELLPEDYEGVAQLREKLKELKENKWIGTWEGDSSKVDIKIAYKNGEYSYIVLYGGYTFYDCKIDESSIVFYSVDDNINNNVNYKFGQTRGSDLTINLDHLYIMKKMSLAYSSETQIKLIKKIEKSSIIFKDDPIKTETETLTKE